jgi:hypothetical protein
MSTRGRNAERWRTHNTLPDARNTTRFKVTIDKTELAMLEELATREAISAAEYIRRLVHEATEELRPKD